MARTHTVTQGEHVSGIASQNGFADYHTVWDDPSNADLKALRENPNVLLPGDQLQLPDPQQRVESRPTGKQHRFVTRAKPLRLRIRVEDLYEKPLANTACELTVEGSARSLTTDGDGILDQPIAPLVTTAQLLFHDSDSALDEIEIPLYIGHLDPVDQQAGQRARLNNLGYFAGALDEEDEDGRLLESAVEEFQCDHDLPVTGDCDDATQAKLKELHGC